MIEIQWKFMSKNFTCDIVTFFIVHEVADDNDDDDNFVKIQA